LRESGTATATDGAALRETGVMKGTTEGAESEGDNDNEVMAGIVPKTGVPAGEALKLAPAALGIPADGIETRTD
jgi:hypothetical protein